MALAPNYVLHIDLFSGIGGFAYAIDQVWPDVEHVFCDNDLFCQHVLKKHWPNSKIYGDIRTITAHAKRERHIHGESEIKSAEPELEVQRQSFTDFRTPFILTGGFPCQPFSQAGRRKGTADDRYLWPEMLRVIREFSPLWVIAENVRGLITWNEGMVLEQVCSDLEGEGYEVQPLIIPAVAVNAPHRRDRVWFVASKRSTGLEEKRPEQQTAGLRGTKCEASNTESRESREQTEWQRREDIGEGNKEGWNVTSPGDKGLQRGEQSGASGKTEGTSRPASKSNSNVKNSICKRSGRGLERGLERPHSYDTDTQRKGRTGSGDKDEGRLGQLNRYGSDQRRNWETNWIEVATEFCSVDDGLPVELDGFKLSKPAHRKEQLKAYGNAIVPQVAIEIMKAIKQLSDN